MQKERTEHRAEVERQARRQREEVDTLTSQVRTIEEASRMRNNELIQRHTRDLEELRQQH